MGKETVITRQVKIGADTKTVEIHKPSAKIETEANMIASKVFARLVREKNEDGSPAYMLRAQLNDNLAKMGIYTDEDIERLTSLSEKIRANEEKLAKGGIKKSEGRNISIELRRLRYSLIMLLSKQVEYDKNTVEHYSENAKMNYLITKCITFEGGSPIFNSVEDYESDELLRGALDEVIREFAGIVSDYDPDAEKKLPENKFLKTYGFCDDNYRLINKNGQFVDVDGNIITEDQEEIVEDKSVLGEFLDDEDEGAVVVFDPMSAEENKVA